MKMKTQLPVLDGFRSLCSCDPKALLVVTNILMYIHFIDNIEALYNATCNLDVFDVINSFLKNINIENGNMILQWFCSHYCICCSKSVFLHISILVPHLYYKKKIDEYGK